MQTTVLNLGERTIILPELDECIEQLTREHVRWVLVEFPIGWKRAASQLAKILENALRVRVAVSGKPCWGVCDTCILQENVDAVIHVGHILTPNLLMVFSRNVSIRLLHQSEHYCMYSVGDNRILTVQYAYYVPERDIINKLLEMLRSSLSDEPLLLYALPYRLYCEELAFQLGLPYSLVTGCYMPHLKADTIVVVSSGYFHAMTPLLLGYRNVMLLDVDRVQLLSSDDVRREFTRRLALKVRALMQAREGRRACVLVSTKLGQRRLDEAERALACLRSSGLEADLVVVDDLTEDILQALDCDFAVSTMCPRLGVDDLDRFSKPIVNVSELQYLLSGRVTELDYRKIIY